MGWGICGLQRRFACWTAPSAGCSCASLAGRSGGPREECLTALGEGLQTAGEKPTLLIRSSRGAALAGEDVARGLFPSTLSFVETLRVSHFIRANKKSPLSRALFNGAPERSRTSDPQIRSLILYPTELLARTLGQTRDNTGKF